MKTLFEIRISPSTYRKLRLKYDVDDAIYEKGEYWEFVKISDSLFAIYYSDVNRNQFYFVRKYNSKQ